MFDEGWMCVCFRVETCVLRVLDSGDMFDDEGVLKRVEVCIGRLRCVKGWRRVLEE